MVVAGDIKEVTSNHPTLGTHTFLAKAGEDSTFDLGGYTVNDDAQGVDGGSNMIKVMNKKRSFFEIVSTNDMNVSEDLEAAQALQDSPINADWTIEHINGAVWKLNGSPVGDLQANGNAGTFTLKVAGGQKMKKIQG